MGKTATKKVVCSKNFYLLEYDKVEVIININPF